MIDERLDDQDSCGQSLMTLVARGTAIITEIHRLSELVPEVFVGHTDQGPAAKQHLGTSGRWTLSDIVCDFSYFAKAESFEARIESELSLKQTDEEFCDTYVDILTRFYLTFESVHRHAADLNRFVVDLEEEIYIGQSLESLLVDTEARQLLCEAYFQLGYMLLLVDLSFEGRLRETLIVAYYRYSSYKSSRSTNLDETCKLMRNTGFIAAERQARCSTSVEAATCSSAPNYSRPPGYPESYFARVGVDQSVVSTLIAKLQTVDIYNQTLGVFPHPDHRSSALAHQAAILFVLLFFCPGILRDQRARMREITDKFFPDNWVLSLSMGELVNLFEAWGPYKAARESLSQIYDSEYASSLAGNYSVRFNRAFKQLDEYLVEGWLCEESFIEHNVRLMNCIREANISLRWLLLHSRLRPGWQGPGNSRSQIRILHAIVAASQPSARKLCEFLQNLCTLEKRVACLFEQVIASRALKMGENKERALETLEELVCIFNDTKPMRWVQPGANLGLAQILTDAKAALVALDLFAGGPDPGQTAPPAARSNRDNIIMLVNRIEAARESYSDGRSQQVVQLFQETRESLLKLLRHLDLSGDLKIILQSVSDFSYAWQLMDELFTRDLQQEIKANPLNLLAFEAVILKLTAAFEGQLVRLQQVGAQTDLISVSQYYSSKLVNYIRQVLQIIPATILELILGLVEIQASRSRRIAQQQQQQPYQRHQRASICAGAMPGKILLDSLRDFAQPEEQQARVLELTRKISHYARGMMAMPATAIGLVRINAKRMLEDGLRRELNEKLRQAIETALRLGGPGGGSSSSTSSTSRGSQQQHQLRESSQRLVGKLEDLALTLGSYKRSLEHIQDFLAIYGLRMWQEELKSIVKSQVELAIRRAIRQHDGHEQQASHSPGPAKSVMSFSSLITIGAKGDAHPGGRQGQVGSPAEDSDFMTRLLDELLRITNAREVTYDEQTSVWHNRKQEQVLDGMRVCELIVSSIGVAGLNGLDRLCATRLSLELEALASPQLVSEPVWQVFGLLSLISSNRFLHNNLAPTNADPQRQLVLGMFFALIGAHQQQQQQQRRQVASERLVDRLLLVGQLQTLRLCVACVLSANCRYEARNLHGCLSAANDILLATLKHGKCLSEAIGQEKQEDKEKGEGDEEEQQQHHHHRRQQAIGSKDSLDCLSAGEASERQAPQTTSGSQLEESQLLLELANQLEWVGLSDPTSKIYTMALHQRRSQQVAGEQQPYFAIDAKGVPSARDTTIIQRLLEESLKINQRQCTQAKQQEQRQLELGSASSILDGRPLYLGIQTLLNHIDRAQVLVAP